MEFGLIQDYLYWTIFKIGLQLNIQKFYKAERNWIGWMKRVNTNI